MQNKHQQIRGVGTDILDTERFKESYTRQGITFLHRIFSQEEIDYCLKFQDPIPHLTARFCGKEAVAKALGTGFGKEIGWLDITISNDAKGKPCVHLTKKVAELFEQPNILLSLSHCKQYATATAIWIHHF